MSDAGETFFTAVGCMDGRVQDPIAEFGRKKFNVLFADTITEAGLVGLLEANDTGSLIGESIKKKLLISVGKHHSKGIIVHGHQECAGNPVEDGLHKDHVKKAAEFIKTLVDVLVIPVFVKRGENGWEVEEL